MTIEQNEPNQDQATMEDVLNQAGGVAAPTPETPAGDGPNQAPQEGATADAQAVTLDPAILKEIQEVAPGMTPEGLVKSYRESRAALGKVQNELTQVKKQYEPFDPIIETMNNDPGYANELARASEEYFSGTAGTSAQDTRQAFDPISNRLRELETRIAQQDMQRSISDLQQKYPDDVDEAVVAAINNRVVQTGDGNVESHFWSLMGPTLVERAQARAQEAAVKEVADNNARFPASVDAQATAPQVPDVKNMTEAEELQAFAEVLGQGGSE